MVKADTVPTGDQAKQGQVPMPNSNPAVNCTVVTLRLSLTARPRQRRANPAVRIPRRGGNWHLRRHLCPLGRHEVTAPQASCGTGPEQATAVAAGVSRVAVACPADVGLPACARGWYGPRDQCLGRTLVL